MFKCYILVFTTREGHFKLFASMSIPAFVNRYKHFIHYIGVPVRAVSGNFKTFKFAKIAAF